MPRCFDRGDDLPFVVAQLCEAGGVLDVRVFGQRRVNQDGSGRCALWIEDLRQDGGVVKGKVLLVGHCVRGRKVLLLLGGDLWNWEQEGE